MKNLIIFFSSVVYVMLIYIEHVHAQRLSSPLGFPQEDTYAGEAQKDYSELRTPFIPRDTSLSGTIMVHILDQDLKPYSGYQFRLEHKDFTSQTWKLYDGYQINVDYIKGKGIPKLIITYLPNGYYRGWAQCMHTGKTGWVPIILDVTKDDDPLAIHQYTLHIPQNQYWLPQQTAQPHVEPIPITTEQKPNVMPKKRKSAKSCIRPS